MKQRVKKRQVKRKLIQNRVKPVKIRVLKLVKKKPIYEETWERVVIKTIQPKARLVPLCQELLLRVTVAALIIGFVLGSRETGPKTEQKPKSKKK